MTVMTYPGLAIVNKNIMDVITNGENQAEYCNVKPLISLVFPPN
ncbi:hypothetical protein [Clostridium estertheticum]|nr:hypothetical protein [Clostridium estertheticum]